MGRRGLERKRIFTSFGGNKHIQITSFNTPKEKNSQLIFVIRYGFTLFVPLSIFHSVLLERTCIKHKLAKWIRILHEGTNNFKSIEIIFQSKVLITSASRTETKAFHQKF